MAYVNAACAGHVTIFSTGCKFRPVSNFTQLHALTLAARSYALLVMLKAERLVKSLWCGHTQELKCVVISKVWYLSPTPILPTPISPTRNQKCDISPTQIKIVSK